MQRNPVKPGKPRCRAIDNQDGIAGYHRTPQDMRIAWVSVEGADENFHRLQSQNHGVNDADSVKDVQKSLSKKPIFLFASNSWLFV